MNPTTRRLALAQALMILAFAVPGLRPHSAPAADPEYTLKGGDRIFVTVFGQDELTTETQLSKSGQINFPLIGTVQLEGQTVDEAAAELTRRLSQGFVVDPKVTVTIRSYSLLQAMILGQVRKPGAIDLSSESPTDLLSAIAIAGGFSELADPTRVSVRRTIDDATRIYTLDARRMATDEKAPAFAIEPGDVISVAQYVPAQVTVIGWVKSPGLVPIPEDRDLGVLNAIALAGGYADDADPRQITVRRRVGGSGKIFHLDAEQLAGDPAKRAFVLSPDDIVTVSAYLPHQFTVLGEVHSPGVFELPRDGGLDLLEAIALAGGYTRIANRKKITVRRKVGGELKIYLINGKRMANDSRARPFVLLPDDQIIVPESFF